VRPNFHDELLPSAVALERAGLKPIELGAKEGLALVNGTQVMTAIAALSVVARSGSPPPPTSSARCRWRPISAASASFDRRNQTTCALIRDRSALQPTCARCWSIPEIVWSHVECERVQDPYSFRCIPVVHGAVRDSTAYVRRVTEVEANSVTDNPLVFPEDGVLSLRRQLPRRAIALAIDFLKMAIGELASIAERRLYLLLNAEDRGLPLFLTERRGLQSGLDGSCNIPPRRWSTTTKAWPGRRAWIQIPTSAGQEDHVSMGMTSANNLLRCSTTWKRRLPANCSASMVAARSPPPAFDLARGRRPHTKSPASASPPGATIALRRRILRPPANLSVRTGSSKPPKAAVGHRLTG